MLDGEGKVESGTDDGPQSGVKDEQVGCKNLTWLEPVSSVADTVSFKSVAIALVLLEFLLNMARNVDLMKGIKDGQGRSSDS